MNPFDEWQPEEQDPQYKELITLLQKANLEPVFVDPQVRVHVLSRARARLVQTGPEIIKFEDTPVPEFSDPGSFPSTPKTLVDKPLRRSRLLHLLTMLAAVLVVAVLLGGSLLLYQHKLPSTGNRFTNATQAYASFVTANGVMFGFDAQHTHANPYEQILNPTTVGGLTKKWAFQTRGAIFYSSPTVANGVVYVGSYNGNLYAFHLPGT